MTFRHVVLFRFIDDISDEAVTAISAGLDALPSQIPEIRTYVHGRDLKLSPGSFDYAVVADFDSAEDWVTYRDHPAHQRFIEEHIVGNVAERAPVQMVWGDS